MVMAIVDRCSANTKTKSRHRCSIRRVRMRVHCCPMCAPERINIVIVIMISNGGRTRIRACRTVPLLGANVYDLCSRGAVQ